MKVTEKQLKRIVLEEKFKLLREANRDGTISPDEEEERDDLMVDVEETIDTLIRHVQEMSEAIGGSFRGPGIRAECFRLIADKIHRAR